MSHFIITWNPNLSMNDSEWLLWASGLRPNEQFNWSTGSRKHGISPGDGLIFLRQARERGVVAIGEATSEIYQGPSWHSDGPSTQQANYVDIKWHQIVPTDLRLETETLLEEVPDVPWNKLFGSGVEIASDADIASIMRLWDDRGIPQAGPERLSEVEALSDPDFDQRLLSVGYSLDELADSTRQSKIMLLMIAEWEDAALNHNGYLISDTDDPEAGKGVSDETLDGDVEALAIERDSPGRPGPPLTEQKIAVEHYAYSVAMQSLEGAGYEVEEVWSTQPYDLVATRSGESWNVEVKGSTTRPKETIDVTYREVESAEAHPTILVVVDGINYSPDGCSGGTAHFWQPWRPKSTGAIEPTSYRYQVAGPGADSIE